ncbi:MAG: hypothetical protein ABI462_03230, partial [Ignavibacteria bacterium]
SFIYAFDSFTHFIKRNKLANESRTLSFNKFGNYVKNLFKLRNNFDKFESQNLRSDILKSIILNKSWLFEKLDELESANK